MASERHIPEEPLFSLPADHADLAPLLLYVVAEHPCLGVRVGGALQVGEGRRSLY